MTRKEASVTFTALVFFGMLIAVVGLIILLLGLGGATTFSIEVGDSKLSTTSTGLAVLGIGAGLSALVALNLPEGVRVFGPTPPRWSDRLRAAAGPLLVVSALAFVGLLVSFFV
jgi:hypothetical protein